MALSLKPITLRAASAYISEKHRHHIPPRGWKFGVGLESDGALCGVVTVGRPVNREFDKDGFTAEVNRLCTDGTKNACSKLYAAARKAAFAMGYRRIITYILENEPGTSLKAAGFQFVKMTAGGSWSCETRPRDQKAPTCPKQLWEAVA
jgi:hypothetical protein